MGDAIDDACTIVRECGVGNPELFFRTIIETHGELGSDDDFSVFKDRFIAKANLEGFGTAGQKLVEQAEGDGGLDFVKVLADEDSQALADHCATLGTEKSDGVAGMAENEELWNNAVAKYGPAWAAWDGSGSGWEEYRDWFYDAASTDDERADAVVRGKLDPLNALEMPERIAQLQEFGFAIEVDTLESVAGLFEEEEEGDDEEVWRAAVEAYGPGWATWDGSESGWVEYRDWFYEATSTDSVQAYSAAHRRLSELDALDLSERIAKLREYGFSIETDILESAAAMFDEAAEQAAEAAARARSSVDQLVEAGQLDPELGKDLTSAFTEVAKEIPEAAGMPEEDIRQLFLEVEQEIQAEGAQS